MKTACLLAFVFIINLATISGQKEGFTSINKNDLKAYMSFFASDAMKGRETGTHENEIAALFLRTNAMRLGLYPIPETGDFLQKVPLQTAEIKAGQTFIKLNDRSGNEIFKSDSILYLMAPFKNLDATSNIVFAGYGLADSITGYNDFNGLELKDKIVMVMTGSPKITDPDELNKVFDISIERPKIMGSIARGARAVLCVYDPRSKYADAYASGIADMGVAKIGTKLITLKSFEGSSPVQIAFITRYTADQILKSSGHNLRSLQEKTIEEKQPVSFELKNNTVTFMTTIEHSDISANNVIGIVEGSDPVLKNEYIIYTAHLDHIGVDKDGEVFNGADDNASGSMALLEVAQAFMQMKKKPLRTIVFAWVNGEEKGLLGSEYYASNPVFPLEKTLIDINLDMVGRSKMPADTGKVMGTDVSVSRQGEILMYTDQKGKDMLALINSASKKAGIKSINMGKDLAFGSSDFAPFMAKGIPTMFFNSGIYPDLHTIRDDVEKIDFDKMECVSKMVFLIGYDLANQKKRFVPDTIK